MSFITLTENRTSVRNTKNCLTVKYICICSGH